MAISKFKENVRKEKNPEETILACALLLRDKKLMEKRSWKEFADKFFGEYKLTIMSCFGYQPEVAEPLPLIAINDRAIVLAVTSELAHRGVFDCGRRELASVLHDRFDMNLTYATILQYICENNSENEDILSSLASKKRVNTKNK